MLKKVLMVLILVIGLPAAGTATAGDPVISGA